MEKKMIRELIENNRLELYGQPKWTFGKNTCNTYELFVENMHTADGKTESAAPVLAQIEGDEELTLLFSRWHLQTAMQAVADLTNHTNSHVTLSLNLLPLYANQHNFTQEVLMLLETTGLHPHKLHFELSEAQSLTDRGVENLNLLHDGYGIGLLLANFGTEHSNVDLLREVHFDGLELDRSFAALVPEHDQTCRVIIAIIHMAHTLDMDVCAKGIENQAQFEFFEELDCAKGQGFLISMPMKLEELPEYIEKYAIKYH